MRESVLKHVDNMTIIIERSEAILCVTAQELLPGCGGPRQIDDSNIALLLCQVKENLKTLREEIDNLWDGVKNCQPIC